ncbi:MAG: hypothetical protein HY551_03715 [Elusimicrobia bacterium]|nr:hypothetical protein [Elusimicrobiota bacterium]
MNCRMMSFTSALMLMAAPCVMARPSDETRRAQAEHAWSETVISNDTLPSILGRPLSPVSGNPRTVAQPVETLNPASLQDQLKEILDGATLCDSGRAKEEVESLDILPGVQSRTEAKNVVKVKGLFDGFCDVKVGLLYFAIQGRMPYRIRQVAGGIWLEDKKGQAVVPVSQVQDYLSQLSDEYYAALYNNPQAGQRPIPRHFTLYVDLYGPQTWSWRLVSDPYNDSPTLRVNQGDEVHLHLIHNIHSQFGYANFSLLTLRDESAGTYDLGLSVEVPPTDQPGLSVPAFVPRKNSRFYDARSAIRVPGNLAVLSRSAD